MSERNELPAEDSTDMQESEALSQFYGTANEVVQKYTHCQLCGANLHFNYITDFSRNLTHESARCPECGIKARQIIHKLQ